MAVQKGIEGVDLVELKIISVDRLPAVAGDFDTAKQTCIGIQGTPFERSGTVGRYPSGPKPAYVHLSNLLALALEQSSTNLHDTSAAIKHFLDEILEADAGARDRMRVAQSQLDGVSGP
ncbi:hypothetical protein BH11ACT8_BH11ACT8_21400 [soil metagenome]